MNAPIEHVKLFLEDGIPRKWLFIGDSITQGCVHTNGMRSYVEHFSEYLRYGLKRKLDVTINTSISGDTTRELVEAFDWRVAQFRPDFVLLMIGMNDCNERVGRPHDEFKSNLETLIDRTQYIGAVPILQTSSPIVKGYARKFEAQFDDYMETVRQVAYGRSLLLVDHCKHWLEQTPFPLSWMNDSFHPNAFGHLSMARYLVRALSLPEKNREYLFLANIPR